MSFEELLEEIKEHGPSLLRVHAARDLLVKEEE